MSKTLDQLRQDIVDVGKLVYQKGWVAANDGNISIRLDDERVLCTPTAISKGMMRPDDLIICDCEGNKIEGRRERTSEIAMHMTIYKLRPDVQSVVHAHPPTATGFAAAGPLSESGIAPRSDHLPGVHSLGGIRVCPARQHSPMACYPTSRITTPS